MDFVKYLDFFSIKFNFYTNNQPNYQNIFGGIMSFIYILICIGIFIGFSYEDLIGLNPTTSISEIPESKSNIINMNKEKIYIPFRIVTENKKFIDHRGILNIFSYYVEGKYNEKIGMDLKYHLLNYKLCNETSMINNTAHFKIDAPLNELFCIEKDDLPFGGSWNRYFINYLEINLFLCKEGIVFNSSDPRCLKIVDFIKKINTSLSFDFFYPVVQFQPMNYEVPMSIIYKNYIYKLSTDSYKIEKLYIREHILSDDKNIIRSNSKNMSCWGLSDLYGDDYYFHNEINSILKNNSSRIYTMEIFLDDGLVYYTRKYKNIFLIISDVFPIFRFFLYFFKKFSQHVKMSIIKRRLAGLIFENKEQEINLKKNNIGNIFKLSKRIIREPKKGKDEIMKDINKISNEKDNIINIKNENNNNIIIKNNMHKEKDKDNDNENSNKIVINKITKKEKAKHKDNDNENNNKIIINKIIHKEKEKDNDNENNIKSNINLNIQNVNMAKLLNSKEVSLINHNNNKSLKEPLKAKVIRKNNYIKKKRKTQKYIFPYYYFFLDIIFDKLIFPQKFFCLSKSYFTVYNFLCQIYDISTHIILFKQFNLLNNMILEKIYEDNGICPSTPYTKINIRDAKTIEKLNKDLKNKKSILFSNNLL